MDQTPTTSPGAVMIFAERIRQLEVEGFDRTRDKKMNSRGQLVFAAIAYAAPKDLTVHLNRGVSINIERAAFFPSSWSSHWYKLTPEDRIKELAKAGALIAAEIDRLL